MTKFQDICNKLNNEVCDGFVVVSYKDTEYEVLLKYNDDKFEIAVDNIDTDSSGMASILLRMNDPSKQYIRLSFSISIDKIVDRAKELLYLGKKFLDCKDLDFIDFIS